MQPPLRPLIVANLRAEFPARRLSCFDRRRQTSAHRKDDGKAMNLLSKQKQISVISAPLVGLSTWKTFQFAFGEYLPSVFLSRIQIRTATSNPATVPKWSKITTLKLSMSGQRANAGQSNRCRKATGRSLRCRELSRSFTRIALPSKTIPHASALIGLPRGPQADRTE